MKKIALIGITVIFALFSFTSCEEGLLVTKGKSGKAEDMLKLIPKDVMAVFYVDVQRVVSIEFINNLIQEKEEEDETSEELTEYEEFKAKTGIDPVKDIHFVVGAITGEAEKGKEEGVGIINLNYDKDQLLSAIKEKIEEEKGEEEEEGEEEEGEEEDKLIEQEYNGFTIYKVKEEKCEEEGEEEKEEKEEEHGEEEEEHVKKKDDECFTFLDKSNIAIGNENGVKSVIDVLAKNKANVFKNEGFSSLLKETNYKATVWGAALIPSEVIKEAISEKPELVILEAVNAASVALDYENQNFIAEIKIMSHDPTKNQELADNLNGYKDMAALIQIQDLNMAEILDRIEITSTPDLVNVYASFPEDLPKTIIEKLKMEKTKEEKKDI
jgi:hypothetical protein